MRKPAGMNRKYGDSPRLFPELVFGPISYGISMKLVIAEFAEHFV
jgi:hypothetical protein